VKTLKQAISLNENYEPARCDLAEVYLITGQDEQGYKELDKCLALGGANNLSYSSTIKKAINHYIEKGDIQTVEKLYQRLSQVERKNPQVWIKMAKLYYQLGKVDQAKQAAQKAAQIKPELKGDLQSFIKELENASPTPQKTTTTIDISPGR
ncbi:MAG TPA: tetratricopeptide repeat protein, partial [Patescibacteria group bacterium]|nr:tetratricopeptide repeat protein [Patescibacteria group bacterium]